MNSRVIRSLLEGSVVALAFVLLAPGSFLPGTSSSDPEDTGTKGVSDFMDSTTTSIGDTLLFVAALAATSSGQTQLAIQRYTKLLEKHPNNPVILHNLKRLNK